MYHRAADSKAWDQKLWNWHQTPSCTVPPWKASGQTARLGLGLCSSTTEMKICPDLACLLRYRRFVPTLLKECLGFPQLSNLPGKQLSLQGAERKQRFASLSRWFCWLGVGQRPFQAVLQACKGIKVTVLRQTRSIAFPHPSWGGSLGKEHTNNIRGKRYCPDTSSVPTKLRLRDLPRHRLYICVEEPLMNISSLSYTIAFGICISVWYS